MHTARTGDVKTQTVTYHSDNAPNWLIAGVKKSFFYSNCNNTETILKCL